MTDYMGIQCGSDISGQGHPNLKSNETYFLMKSDTRRNIKEAPVRGSIN
jgi:hypothetical protein